VAQEFRLPDLGEGLTEGEIGRWLVAEGQQVAEDDPLVEIVTDKTSVEIPSPYAGTVERLHVAEGDVVAVGAVIVSIADTATETVAGDAPAAAAGAATVRATPLVRRLARELGLDLAGVEGSGRQGEILERDLRAQARVETASPPAGPAGGGERRQRLRGVRRTSAERLSAAHREVPAVTFVEECDFNGVELGSLLALALQAVARTLPAFPELNARLEGDEVVLIDRYDLGFAVQTEAGLLVPVVRGCERLDLAGLETEIHRLVEGARAGTLTAAELRGSTFTVTSAGKLGGLLVTPLVNYPEVAILGLHRIGERPVVRGGEIVARPVGNVSVTFDHRVVDGARAAAFCLAVIDCLQQAAA
jgi:pyruvate/2-oxoglutarate dehydrogenase complex dihydrolipoamide acyltransferase (E2) component